MLAMAVQFVVAMYGIQHHGGVISDMYVEPFRAYPATLALGVIVVFNTLLYAIMAESLVVVRYFCPPSARKDYWEWARPKVLHVTRPTFYGSPVLLGAYNSVDNAIRYALGQTGMVVL